MDPRCGAVLRFLWGAQAEHYEPGKSSGTPPGPEEEAPEACGLGFRVWGLGFRV